MCRNSASDRPHTNPLWSEPRPQTTGVIVAKVYNILSAFLLTDWLLNSQSSLGYNLGQYKKDFS